MEKTSKATGLFTGIMIILATLFHGGFFSIEYIVLTIAFLVFILVSKEISVSVTGFLLMLGVVLLYCLSSVFSDFNTGRAFSESARPLLMLGALSLGARVQKTSFMKSLIVAATSLGVIGLLSLCRVVEFKDFVYVYDGVKSLQSTMQYANTTAVVLICGIFSVRAMQRNDSHRFVYALAEILLTICMLFTHSKIAIAVYILLTLAELLLLKEGISTSLICHSLGSVMVYLLMQFLIQRKLSFVALAVCIIAVLLLSERSTAIGKKTININRLSALLLSGGVLIIMVASLWFMDISTIMIRLLYYKDGLKALIQNPLLGLSPGGWADYQYNYQSAQYFVSQVHNGVLQVGLDAGILSMIMFVALVVVAFAGLVKLWKKHRATDDLYVLLIFSTLILHGFFDFDFSYGNILIILGICISYGFAKTHDLNLRIGYKLLAGLCSVFLICTAVSQALAFFGESEFNQGNHQKASDYYGVVVKLSPWDADSAIKLSLCREKTGNEGNAVKLVDEIFQKNPRNQRIIQQAMDIAAEKKDFSIYIAYQDSLLEAAPMQQSTYSNSIRYLDAFRQGDLIDEELYLKEKNSVISSAIGANNRMSKFKKYLSFGADIDISALN